MSQDQARLVIERMKTDEAFRERILAAEDVAERLRLAEAEGYVVRKEDVEKAAMELSDAELTGVVGGGEWSSERHSSCDCWAHSLCHECPGADCDYWG